MHPSYARHMDTSERRFLARDNPGMTHSTEDLHVYVRHINADERTSLSVLAQWVPQGATVLDLGCGSGALGQYLAQHRACTTDGITWSEAEAAHARPHYRRVEVADLETADLHTLLAGQRYDRIVCADVLEHLRQPERILDTCRALLASDGQLLISVPNAAYCGLVAELLHGEFRYRDEGLLDRTHLRFFTRSSLTRFLHEQQWAINALDTIQCEWPESEFQVTLDSIPPAVTRYLLAQQDALTYQFIAAAKPARTDAAAAVPFSVVASATTPAHAIFTAQLYLGERGQYAEINKMIATGIMGTSPQTLQFPLPVFEGSLPRLRLDPADRPGFMHLHAITLRNAEGRMCWQWRSGDHTHTLPGKEAHQQITWHAPWPTASDTTLLLLTGDDPWFELPIPTDTLAQCLQTAGSVLEVRLGWPMSADYLALSSTVGDLQAQIAHMETALARAQQDRIEASAALAANAAQIQHLTHAQQQYEQLQVQLQLKQQQLQAHLQGIENSTVFKATRPIVRAKMRLDRLLGRSHPPASMAESPPPVTPPPTLTPPSKAAPPATAETTTATLATQDQVNTPAPVPASTVDIIVPVYRGLADTQLCVNSVLASTCATPYRLVIINDASPEPEVTTWLRQRAAQEPRITLLENPENLGFVGTVNRGMALSDSHDVLLLNSDTEVANDWLDRIRRAAYSDRKVASVTPFSNNATICSYPKFCQDNRLPRGYDTARMDALCAQTNPGAVVDVPTGVGFCMYIRRDCLAQVGLFDTTHFGKGYGEENDFCQRAAQAGWRNLHLLDTFVLHTGGVSFGASKSPREQAAMETLRRLHPHYEAEVQTFVAQDPAHPYRHALDFARLRASVLPRILTVLHNAGGGTQRHTEELAAHLQDKVISLSLVPLPDHIMRLTWNAPHEALCKTYHWPTQSHELLDTLRRIGVCHMHYHHLLGVNPEIMLIPAQLGITYDFTAHDYYTACPQISLTDSHHNYCGEQSLAQCTACLAQRPAPTAETIENWRLRHRVFLRNARYLLTPSRDAAARLHRYFPTANLRFAPHLDIATDTILPQPQPRRLAPDAYMRILVIGAVNEAKGASMLEAAALQAAQNSAPLEFHLVGYAHRTLQTQPHASLTIHGAYADRDLPRLLERLRPDIAWFPARLPETYSYTLSACLLAGVPIMAPNLGAFPERLSQRPWTWIRPWETNAQTWVEIFETLRNQHFVTGQPPPLAPEFVAALPESSAAPWSYTTDYLDHLGAAQTPPVP